MFTFALFHNFLSSFCCQLLISSFLLFSCSLFSSHLLSLVFSMKNLKWLLPFLSWIAYSMKIISWVNFTSFLIQIERCGARAKRGPRHMCYPKEAIRFACWWVAETEETNKARGEGKKTWSVFCLDSCPSCFLFLLVPNFFCIAFPHIVILLSDSLFLLLVLFFLYLSPLHYDHLNAPEPFSLHLIVHSLPLISSSFFFLRFVVVFLILDLSLHFFQLRHDHLNELEALKSMLLFLDRPLASSFSVPFYLSFQDAVMGKNKLADGRSVTPKWTRKETDVGGKAKERREPEGLQSKHLTFLEEQIKHNNEEEWIQNQEKCTHSFSTESANWTRVFPLVLLSLPRTRFHFCSCCLCILSASCFSSCLPCLYFSITLCNLHASCFRLFRCCLSLPVSASFPCPHHLGSWFPRSCFLSSTSLQSLLFLFLSFCCCRLSLLCHPHLSCPYHCHHHPSSFLVSNGSSGVLIPSGAVVPVFLSSTSLQANNNKLKLPTGIHGGDVLMGSVYFSKTLTAKPGKKNKIRGMSVYWIVFALFFGFAFLPSWTYWFVLLPFAFLFFSSSPVYFFRTFSFCVSFLWRPMLSFRLFFFAVSLSQYLSFILSRSLLSLVSSLLFLCCFLLSSFSIFNSLCCAFHRLTIGSFTTTPSFVAFSSSCACCALSSCFSFLCFFIIIISCFFCHNQCSSCWWLFLATISRAISWFATQLPLFVTSQYGYSRFFRSSQRCTRQREALCSSLFWNLSTFVCKMAQSVSAARNELSMHGWKVRERASRKEEKSSHEKTQEFASWENTSQLLCTFVCPRFCAISSFSRQFFSSVYSVCCFFFWFFLFLLFAFSLPASPLALQYWSLIAPSRDCCCCWWDRQPDRSTGISHCQAESTSLSCTSPHSPFHHLSPLHRSFSFIRRLIHASVHLKICPTFRSADSCLVDRDALRFVPFDFSFVHFNSLAFCHVLFLFFLVLFCSFRNYYIFMVGAFLLNKKPSFFRPLLLAFLRPHLPLSFFLFFLVWIPLSRRDNMIHIKIFLWIVWSEKRELSRNYSMVGLLSCGRF